MPAKKKRIQVVEDDVIVAKDIEESLRGFGYDITSVVATGEDAIKEAEKKKPDLVLMDIRLKGEMDGIQAAEEIRKKLSIPVIYLTAYSDEKTLQRAKITEPFGYILKPFEERMLYTVIEMALYRHDIETKLRQLKEFNENIVENMPVGVAVIDLDRRITAINRIEEELFGVKREDALGKILYSEYLKNLRERMEPLLNKIYKKGESVQELNVTYSDDAGKERVLDIFMSPLMDNQKITGAVIASRDATDKRRLKDRVRVLERKEVFQLTENDRFVLWGLVRYPQLNNIELAKKLGMKRTTLIGIRNKIKRRGFYTTVMVPDLESLGIGLITIEYAGFVDAFKLGTDLKDEAKYAEYAEMIVTENEYYAMIATKDIGKYRMIINPVELKDGNADALKNLSTMHFSLNSSKVSRLFDYGDILKKWFSIDHKDTEPLIRKHTARKLTDNELKVMYALARYPQGSEKKISDNTKLSKVTVNQIKRRLLEESLVRLVRIPNLKKIGCGLILLMSVRLNPTGGDGKHADTVSKDFVASTYISDAREAFMMVPFRDFTDYKTAYDKYLSSRNESLAESPRTLLIPVSKVKTWKLDYAPLIKKASKDSD